MAAYGSPTSGGENLYDDGPEAGAAAAAQPKEDEGGSTALLPKSFFSGKELTPGTECKVRIERVHDDQVEVSYVPHESEESEEAAEAQPPASDEEMAGMMG